MLPSNEISSLFFNLVNGIFIPEKNANSLYKMYQTGQDASLELNRRNCQNCFAVNGLSLCCQFPFGEDKDRKEKKTTYQKCNTVGDDEHFTCQIKGSHVETKFRAYGGGEDFCFLCIVRNRNIDKHQTYPRMVGGLRVLKGEHNFP